jgi:hypothetical protein
MVKSLKARNGSSVGAGVAGASSGTGLLALVTSLPESNPWKPVLVYAAPTVSIVVGAVWLFVMQQLNNWIADRSLTIESEKAEKALKLIELDGSSSDRLKKEARAKVEALRLLKVSLHSKRAETIVDL